MRFILCQPAIPRFKWELDVCLTNLKQHGIDDIILLFTDRDKDIPVYFYKKYHAECFVVPDIRPDRTYIPAIKPYLWWQFLRSNPSAERGEYFYMDADVIFRELPDFGKIEHSPNLWRGSDTESYIGPDYIASKGTGYLPTMAEIVGLTEQQVNSLRGCSAGAQWIITDPKADYWLKVYEDSLRLYHYFEGAERIEQAKHERGYMPLQKWTAEMWAQLWNMPLFGIKPYISHELDFAMATDDIRKWGKVKILHNAGVTVANKDLFYKAPYTWTEPFNEDFSYVNRHRCSWRYVQAINQAKKVIADGHL